MGRNKKPRSAERSGPTGGSGPAGARLSVRQCEALALLEAGCSYSQAAARMGVAKGTAQIHVRRARARLGLPLTAAPTGPDPPSASRPHRPQEALALAEAGCSYPQIAERMGITAKTVREYVGDARRDRRRQRQDA